jgi:hypothetical protein
MKHAILAVAVIAAVSSAQAFAATDAGRTIVTLGSQGTGFVQVAPALSQPCKFSSIYLPDLSQPSARGMMAVLISAQARNAPITITYDIDASGICIAKTIAAW